MLLLLNSTKTMRFDVNIPKRIKTTLPDFLETSAFLAGKLSILNQPQLAELMLLSDKLATETKTRADQWGKPGQPKTQTLFCFSGPLYKSLNALDFNTSQLKAAQERIRILSGLYGLLRPFDLIEAYRLEMGLKFQVNQSKNIAQFWKKKITSRLNRELVPGKPVISVAAQEYMRAIDIKALNAPVILPVFKEVRPDGTFKNVAVHSKKARGALVKYAIVNQIKSPEGLKDFCEMGWKAAEDPPGYGPWLFTRPEGY